MKKERKKVIRYLSLCGLLGYGYAPESLENALKGELDFVGVDAGSTDPGPYYLGSGKNFVKKLQVKRDLSLILPVIKERKIPLIIGSSGGSGAAPHVQETLDIITEIAKEKSLSFRVAVIPSDLPEGFVKEAAKGHLFPCGGSPEFDPALADKLANAVAQFGTDPIIEALKKDPEIIVSGRCCDTAVFASYPILMGFDPGLALHAAKIAECGALCARPVGANDSLVVEMHEDFFTVQPPNPLRKCTPDSVAAHSLYEQPDPNCFYEPEGKIDLSACTFQQAGEGKVKVSGSRLVPAEKKTLKLEGAFLAGYRAITIAGLRDPSGIRHLKEIEEGVRASVAQSANFVKEGEYSLRFLRYGLDAVTGKNEPENPVLPREVGLVIEAVAPTQEKADALVGLARSKALHQGFPDRKATAGNLAFPFSPSDFSGGAVYEFALYHLTDLSIPFKVKEVNIP
ncbi:MAG: acyclic terpene utilization AtuA family protein [Lentisphaeria bacterium]|nr:acyclic terpene utilization AtuA family protein [Lentisphaeria bacterium]